jgi:hypothetical protein
MTEALPISNLIENLRYLGTHRLASRWLQGDAEGFIIAALQQNNQPNRD